jgi:hypothetical protein
MRTARRPKDRAMSEGWSQNPFLESHAFAMVW